MYVGRQQLLQLQLCPASSQPALGTDIACRRRNKGSACPACLPAHRQLMRRAALRCCRLARLCVCLQVLC